MLDRLASLRADFAGTIQDICAGCVIVLIVAVALVVVP